MKCETNAFHWMITDNQSEVNSRVNCQGGIKRGIAGSFVTVPISSVIMYIRYKDPREGDILNCWKYDVT